MPAHRCLTWALSGALLGLAIVAYGQDPVTASAPVAGDPSRMLVDLVGGGGLPAVLALLGWLAGRWGGIPVQLTVRLHDDDRRLARRLARATDPDDSDNPPSR